MDERMAPAKHLPAVSGPHSPQSQASNQGMTTTEGRASVPHPQANETSSPPASPRPRHAGKSADTPPPSLTKTAATADESQSARQLRAIAQLGQRVAAVEDLDALLNYLVNLLHSEFGYPHADLFLLDDDEAQLVLRASVDTLPVPPHTVPLDAD